MIQQPEDSAGLPVAGSPFLSMNRRGTIQWRSLGFSNEAKMVAMRNYRKVSKRKTDFLKNGRKVTYRCNNWKRSRCPFQMKALYTNDGLVELFETCAEHNHNITRKVNLDAEKEASTEETEVEMLVEAPRAVIVNDATPSEENDEEGCEEKVRIDDSGAADVFQLVDNAGVLIKMAKDRGYSLSFNALGSGEYVLSRAKHPNDKRVVIREDDDHIHIFVHDSHDSGFVVAQKWTKSVLSMFEFAISGICFQFLH